VNVHVVSVMSALVPCTATPPWARCTPVRDTVTLTSRRLHIEVDGAWMVTPGKLPGHGVKQGGSHADADADRAGEALMGGRGDPPVYCAPDDGLGDHGRHNDDRQPGGEEEPPPAQPRYGPDRAVLDGRFRRPAANRIPLSAQAAPEGSRAPPQYGCR
jgi:hypothetical protein